MWEGGWLEPEPSNPEEHTQPIGHAHTPEGKQLGARCARRTVSDLKVKERARAPPCSEGGGTALCAKTEGEPKEGLPNSGGSRAILRRRRIRLLLAVFSGNLVPDRFASLR